MRLAQDRCGRWQSSRSRVRRRARVVPVAVQAAAIRMTLAAVATKMATARPHSTAQRTSPAASRTARPSRPRSSAAWTLTAPMRARTASSAKTTSAPPAWDARASRDVPTRNADRPIRPGSSARPIIAAKPSRASRRQIARPTSIAPPATVSGAHARPTRLARATASMANAPARSVLASFHEGERSRFPHTRRKNESAFRSLTLHWKIGDKQAFTVVQSCARHLFAAVTSDSSNTRELRQ